MKTKSKILAICVSDLHLSLLQPACRADRHWLEVQREYLYQLSQLADGLPILCAGDIFDRWNCSPELINFALTTLPPNMICIPGQHDLPNHNLGELRRSAYGTLCAAKKIIDIGESYEPPFCTADLVVYPFNWNEEIKPCPSKHPEDKRSVALIHKYIWKDERDRYQDAPVQASLKKHVKIFETYDFTIIGDNHKGWQTVLPRKGEVINCGTFIRRKTDEIDYKPGYGVLRSDGTIGRGYFDTSKDQFHENAKQREEVAVNMQEFIEGLEGLGEHGVDFREAVKRHMIQNEINTQTIKILMECIQEGK